MPLVSKTDMPRASFDPLQGRRLLDQIQTGVRPQSVALQPESRYIAGAGCEVARGTPDQSLRALGRAALLA